MIAEGDAAYQQEPFKEAAWPHLKSGLQHLLRLRFYLFSPNLPTLLWLGCFQTLPQPQLGERDTLYLTANLLITVTFPVFADATNFCLC